MTKDPKYGLVLSGGGARGAYEAGVLYYLRTRLPKEIATSPLFQIYCGTSVGAINTAFLGSTAHDPLYQGSTLRKLWQHLNDKDIYRTDIKALSGILLRSSMFMAGSFLGFQRLAKKQQQSHAPHSFTNILDTSPFVYFLSRNVAWPQIHRNIQRRVFDALTVSATDMMSGELTLFVEKHPEVVYRQGKPEPLPVQLAPKHILASAALPLLFPVIRVNRRFYGDGSLRQNTPMSPAIHLGANRILVISTHHKEHEGSLQKTAGTQPRLGDVLGTLLQALFMDRLDYDLEQMWRINHLITDMERFYGIQALEQINRERRDNEQSKPAGHAISKIIPFVVRPSQNIGLIAAEAFARLLSHRKTLSPVQKFFSKVMEGSPEHPNDLMSLLIFDGEYLNTLLELGYEDARAEHEKLVAFFTDAFP